MSKTEGFLPEDLQSRHTDNGLHEQAGVHFTLCGGSLCNLGTKKHHDMYLSKMDTLEERGCFAMTELGHGSNVMGIETTVSQSNLLAPKNIRHP